MRYSSSPPCMTSQLERRQQVDAVLLDFIMAFAKVPRYRLAVKLHHYDIRDKNLSWIQSAINKLSMMGKHFLLLLSRLDFLEYCSWASSVACTHS